jgi:hypothetical protein
MLVEVRVINGRALYVEEADGGWMYGVNPGGMTARGASLQDAHQAFRQVFSNILVDLILDPTCRTTSSNRKPSSPPECAGGSPDHALPLGPHGRRVNPEIETGYVRSLARHLGIEECARSHLALG